ncbi:hypothetical protein F5Y06DRAFT_111182 [Hypoxylon sp. FL0890]|nr:hypothetical protein F5Y06DRAFT_111182 [Hypoxylon sp. FL0890]
MRILDIFVVTVLATEVTAKCVTNECFRVLQNAPVSIREEDCKSFVQVTKTPATSTIFSSFTITTTGSTTRTTTQTITSSAEPSKRWLQRHEVIDLLMGRATSSDGPDTVRATIIPAYASPCASSVAYESACSCLGVSPTTKTAPTPSTTQVLRIVETTTVTAVHTIKSYATGAHNSSLLLGNSTAPFLNATSSELSLSSSIVSSSSSTLMSSESRTSTDKYRLKSPSVAATASSAEVGAVLGSTSSTIGSSVSMNSKTGFSNAANFTSFPNATSSSDRFLNFTSPASQTGTPIRTNSQSGTAGESSIVNVTSSAPFLNSTRAATANTTSPAAHVSNSITSAPFLNSTQAVFANLTSSAAKDPNSTISAPFRNITSTPLLNNTLASFLNTTHTPLPINATTTARFLNSTSTVRFANTTSATPTPTPTTTCESTSNPFAVRVSQPGGLFDGWYLQISGDGVIFNPSIDRASKFSFDSQNKGKSHLCSLGGAGLAGNASAVVAIAENRTDATGSAVWFVDPEVLEDIDNDQHRWYAPLECSGNSGAGSGSNSTLNSTAAIATRADSTLACAQGSKEYWVGCGLGLDITSDGDGVAVVDGWNCTAVTLSIEYSSSS